MTDWEGPGTVCCPVWAPDGQRLAFLSPDLTLRTIEIERGRSGPRQDTILARPPEGVWFEPTAWSLDGSRLAGQERRGSNPHAGIGAYDLETSEYTSFTQFGGEPHWFSDGRRIVFHDQHSYYVLDTVSTEVRRLLSVAPYRAGGSSLTPDDRWLYLSVHATEANVWVATAR